MKKFYPMLNTGMMLVVANFTVNMLNFLFNAFLGRNLSLDQFAIVTVVNSLYYIISIPLLALSNTVNHWVAFLGNTEGKTAATTFFISLRTRVWIIAGVCTILWLISLISLQSFFQLSSVLPLLSITPLLFLTPFLALVKGYFQGSFAFLLVSIIIISEVVTKIVLAFFFINSERDFMYLTIPFSACISAGISILLVLLQKQRAIEKKSYAFPSSFFFFALLNALISSAFLSVDVIIVKHFSSAIIAGEYSLLSLVGKIIYFFGSVGNILLITYISRDEAKMKNLQNSFWLFLLAAVVLTSSIFVVLGPLGAIFVPLLLGAKTLSIVPYLLPYALAISLFTITTTLISFHVTLHHYLFSAVALLATVGMILGITLHHDNLSQIVNVLLITNVSSLVTAVVLHLFSHSQHVSIQKLYSTK